MSIKGQGYSLTLGKGHLNIKIKHVFSQKRLNHLKPKLIWKLSMRMGMKIYINEFGHEIKMAAMPIYGKNF